MGWAKLSLNGFKKKMLTYFLPKNGTEQFYRALYFYQIVKIINLGQFRDHMPSLKCKFNVRLEIK